MISSRPHELKLIDLISLKPGSVLTIHSVKGEVACDQAAQWTENRGWKHQVSNAMFSNEENRKRENMAKLLDIHVDAQVIIRHEDSKVVEIMRLDPGTWDNLLANTGRNADVMVDGRILAHGTIVNDEQQSGILITRLP